MKPLTVDEFRAEVQDKLGVVFNGCKSSPLERSCHRRQCEDFLVERYAEAVGDTLVSPAPETELQRAIARIVLKWSVSSRMETQDVLQELEALVPDSVWSGAGRKPEVVAPPPPACEHVRRVQCGYPNHGEVTCAKCGIVLEAAPPPPAVDLEVWGVFWNGNYIHDSRAVR